MTQFRIEDKIGIAVINRMIAFVQIAVLISVVRMRVRFMKPAGGVVQSKAKDDVKACVTQLIKFALLGLNIPQVDDPRFRVKAPPTQSNHFGRDTCRALRWQIDAVISDKHPHIT